MVVEIGAHQLRMSRIRELFASAFDREPGIEVVAQAGSLAEARRFLDGVDVAVLDLSLPDGDGTDIIGELRATNPHGVALVLTASLDLGTYARAVAAGTAGKPVSIHVERFNPALRLYERVGRGQGRLPAHTAAG